MLSAMISRDCSEKRIPIEVSDCECSKAGDLGKDTFTTHRNGIRDSNGIVLPGQHALLFHSSFDGVCKI